MDPCGSFYVSGVWQVMCDGYRGWKVFTTTYFYFVHTSLRQPLTKKCCMALLHCFLGYNKLFFYPFIYVVFNNINLLYIVKNDISYKQLNTVFYIGFKNIK